MALSASYHLSSWTNNRRVFHISWCDANGIKHAACVWRVLNTSIINQECLAIPHNISRFCWFFKILWEWEVCSDAISTRSGNFPIYLHFSCVVISSLIHYANVEIVRNSQHHSLIVNISIFQPCFLHSAQRSLYFFT